MDRIKKIVFMGAIVIMSVLQYSCNKVALEEFEGDYSVVNPVKYEF